MNLDEALKSFEDLVPEAVSTIRDVMNNGSADSVRLKAALAVIERVDGKPGVKPRSDGLAEGFEGMTPQQRIVALKQAIEMEEKNLMTNVLNFPSLDS